MLRRNCVADGVSHPTKERGVSGPLGESGGGGVKADTMDQPSNSLPSLLSRHVNISLSSRCGNKNPRYPKQPRIKLSRHLTQTLDHAAIYCTILQLLRPYLGTMKCIIAVRSFYTVCLFMKHIQDKCLHIYRSYN